MIQWKSKQWSQKDKVILLMTLCSYALMKTGLSELQALFWYQLKSGSTRTRNVIVWFSFCFWLQQSSFHKITRAKNYWKKMLRLVQLLFYWAHDWDLMTAILFWISSMSVATENQPLDYIPCSKRTIKHKQPLNRTASVNRQDSSI